MIKQQLQKDQIAAMKAGEKEKLTTIRYIVSQIKNKEIDTQRELTDEEVIQILRKQAKELKDAIETFQTGGRADLVAENQAQIEIITAYLPAEMPDEQLSAEIDRIVAENQDVVAKNPKAIIGVIMKELRSKADPSRINAMLKQKLLL